jgi:hypothetical protein
MPDLTFNAPEGFTPPEHLDSDDTFQAMCTIKILGGEELQLVDIEGYEIGKEDTEGDTEAAQETEQGNIREALQGAGSAASAEANMGAPTPATGAGLPGGAPGAALGTQASFASQAAARFRRATGRR